MNAATFIVGTGRCGSTALYDIMTFHRDVTWLSNLLSIFPTQPAINRVASGVPSLLQRFMRVRVRPDECYPFWEHHATGFTEPFRDLVEDDLTRSDARRLQLSLRAALRPGRRPLFKLTGWPRMLYLDAAFPEARFIHLERDPRAVVSSLLHVEFWSGWRGPDNWRWGPLSDAHRALWEKHARSFVALAAIELKILDDAYEACKEILGERVLELSYEELCEEPCISVKRSLEFMGIGMDRAVERAMRRSPFRSSNDRWRQNLSEHQITVLLESLHALDLLPYR